MAFMGGPGNSRVLSPRANDARTAYEDINIEQRRHLWASDD
ncbi:hypothetical protein Pan54_15010 [Rubinisphaera italica]|uniref:Uncharacterized protein n=1 Tax=Rubinisphaera italica TaxID=2527969 RepID=A0A5C5XDC3_9PLAN|nr:hypothetical protein Pan54_15010 [Rubinisphaera italica]